jgi:tetratricopeptide (TPR) repeat protein
MSEALGFAGDRDLIVTMTSRRSRLVGWKAIGAFLGRDARTAKRWEADRALPVRRAPGGKRPTVWADTSELEGWMVGRRAPARPGSAVDTAPYDDLPEVRDHYLDACYALSRRTAASLDLAMTAFTELARRYPGRAAAYAGLAECHLLSREFGAAPEAAAYAMAGAAARQARSLEPTSADAVRALGFIALWQSADVETGLALLEQAVSLAPANARARHWLATALGARGDLAAAQTEIAAAQRFDPQSTSILADRALLRFAAGSREGGRAALEQLTQLAPEFSASHAYLAHLDLVEDRDADFPDHMEADARLRRDAPALQLARRLRTVLAESGPIAMRRANAAGRQQLHLAGQAGAFQVAQAWAAASEPRAAIEWLHVCRIRGEPSLVAATGDMVLHAFLRGSPRFEAFKQAL